ncbi:hypothetical protein ACO0K9_05900 [Undibacterium sp. Ji50W]|uniref:antitoxin PaaA2 family protein n=1 Tax=Undibacterium sp. Ji50W TaxID=3413041 RepID=UPI003BF14532
MINNTIDTAMAKRMVDAAAIHGASIIGQPGGWGVMLKFGATEKPLGAQRTGQPRVWRSLDRCMDYLKTELHITRVDLLDASKHSETPDKIKVRTDTSERMRRAHEAAAYDKWFREQVQVSLDDPTPGIANEEVKQKFAAKRAALTQRIAGNKV